jgi:uncharacterized protein involved in exopolysaccharide biosynthesis
MHRELDPPVKSSLDHILSGPPWSLRDVVAVSWRARWIIAAIALAGAVVGAALGSLTPPRYEATTTFMVTQRAGLQTAFRTFEAVLKSNGLGSELVRQFRLDQPPTSLTAASFMRDHLIIEQVRDTNLLRVHVSLHDAKLTTDVANGLAAHALKLYDDLNAKADVGPSPDDLKRQKTLLDDATAARDAAENRLLNFRSQAQIDMLRRNANELFDAARRLENLRITLQAERGRLTSMEAELANLPKTISVPRQLTVSDALLLSIAESEKGRPGAEAIAKELTRTELVNPVYGQLETQAAMLRTSVAALEAELQALANQLTPSRSPSQQLADVYRRESELARLQRELDMAGRVFSSASERYDQMRNATTESLPRPELIDPASLPDQSLSRGMLAGGIAGLLAGLLAALVYALGRAVLTAIMTPRALELR